MIRHSLYCSSDVRLVEMALKTLAAVLSRVKGADSWALVQELLVYLCAILDSKLAKERGESTTEAVGELTGVHVFLQHSAHAKFFVCKVVKLHFQLHFCSIALYSKLFLPSTFISDNCTFPKPMLYDPIPPVFSRIH